MSIFIPVNARSYYDYLPSVRHECGDIWIDLPSVDLLSAHNRVTGIIVTPACDVSNFKAETLTFLPVIPIAAYLGTVALLPIIRREVIERYKSARLNMEMVWPEKGYEPPLEGALLSEISRLQDILSTSRLSKNEMTHIDRAASGLRIAIVCRSASKKMANLEDYTKLFGNKWDDMKRDIVKNSFRSDIHFLPKDENSLEGFGMAAHSVALFRYPISVPAEILTAAQSVSAGSWSNYMDSYSSVYSASRHFREAMPVKILSLKASFLSDLLSRFTALYGRIGSPDFSSATIDKYVGEIA